MQPGVKPMQGIDALALKPYFDTNIDCICQNMKFEKKILEWAKLNRAWSHEWKNLHTRAKQSAGNDSVASKKPYCDTNIDYIRQNMTFEIFPRAREIKQGVVS